MRNLKKRLIILAIAFALIFEGDSFASQQTCSKDNNSNNWPSYGHDLSNTRHAAKQTILNKCNVKDLQVKWNFNQAQLFTANASVVNDVLYSVDAANAWALDANTGAVVWQQSFASIPNLTLEVAGVCVGKGLVFIPASDFNTFDSGYVIALNQSTGAIVWQSPNLISSPGEYLASAPVLIEEDNIVLMAKAGYQSFAPNPTNQNGGIFALNASTGAIIWNYVTSGAATTGQPNSGGTGCGIFGTPSVDVKSGLLFIGTGQNYSLPVTPLSDSLLALNYRTTNPNGELVWYHQYTFDDIGQKDWDADGGPILMTVENREGKKEKIVVVGTKQGYLYAHRSKDGKLLWTTALTNANPQVSDLGGVNTFGCADEDTIYMPSIYSTDGLPLLQAGGFSLPVNGGTSIFAVRASDGHILWRKDFNGVTLGPLSIANGILFHVISLATTPPGSDDNPFAYLRALDTKTGNVLFEYIYDSQPFANEGSNLVYTGTTVYKNKIIFPYGNSFGQPGVTAGWMVFDLPKNNGN